MRFKEVLVASQANIPQFFSDSDHSAVRCLAAAQGRSGYAAVSAVIHLLKAWSIRRDDSPMAAFRAITAEEEAATAILSLLRERDYAHSKLDLHDHTVKHSVYPFIRELGAVLLPPLRKILLKVSPVIDVKNGSAVMEIDYTLLDGSIVRMNPPLGFKYSSGPVRGLSDDQLMSLPASLSVSKLTIRESSDDESAASIVPNQSALNFAEMLDMRLSIRARGYGYQKFLQQVKDQANLKETRFSIQGPRNGLAA
jgi:hypothetical protein